MAMRLSQDRVATQPPDICVGNVALVADYTQAFVLPHLSTSCPLETPSLGRGEAWALGDVTCLGVRMAHSLAGDLGAGDRRAV